MAKNEVVVSVKAYANYRALLAALSSIDASLKALVKADPTDDAVRRLTEDGKLSGYGIGEGWTSGGVAPGSSYGTKSGSSYGSGAVISYN